jgi:hypothetical protein
MCKYKEISWPEFLKHPSSSALLRHLRLPTGGNLSTVLFLVCTQLESEQVSTHTQLDLMVLIGGAEERSGIKSNLPRTACHIQRVKKRLTTTHSPWRWQLQCLPKRWLILNIRRSSPPKAEVTHWTPRGKPKDKNYMLPCLMDTGCRYKCLTIHIYKFTSSSYSITKLGPCGLFRSQFGHHLRDA